MSDEGETRDLLIAAAERAREHAYAPYSQFPVGAAVMTGSGEVVTGCNVENASYGLSVCAERVALWRAVAQGHRDLAGLAIVVASGTPCGACRQVLSELCDPAMPVWVKTDAGSVRRFTVAELLPAAFQAEDLAEHV